jgi:hypothetical protein
MALSPFLPRPHGRFVPASARLHRTGLHRFSSPRLTCLARTRWRRERQQSPGHATDRRPGAASNIGLASCRRPRQRQRLAADCACQPRSSTPSTAWWLLPQHWLALPRGSWRSPSQLARSLPDSRHPVVPVSTAMVLPVMLRSLAQSLFVATPASAGFQSVAMAGFRRRKAPQTIWHRQFFQTRYGP